MADYSQAADSQAAYADMPNQGLPTSTFGSSMTQADRQKLAAQMLMQGMQQKAAPMTMNAAPGQRAALPTQTVSGGQFMNPMGAQ